MSIPAIQQARIGAYIMKRLASGTKRFPLVLMLEPLFQCNLRCKICGKIGYPDEILNKRLSVSECVEAAEECGAPVVSIPGGEPLLHPDIHVVVRELAKRKRFVYLCTNGQLVESRLKDFEPSPYLSFNVHLDGLRERHDELVNREGVFDRSVAAIRKLVSKGFRVTTNTTLYRGTSPESAAELFDLLTSLGVENLTVAAGFSYEKAAAQDMFLDRESTKELFRAIFKLGASRKWPLNHSSLYLRFLAGREEYQCSPWGVPTRNIFGWQRPCYILNDGYAPTYRQLLEETEWDKYGVGRDSRCANCMMHSGFEPSAVNDAVRHPLKALRASLAGLSGL